MKKILLTALFCVVIAGGLYAITDDRNNAKVLIVQRTYDGPVEIAAGDVVRFQYTQPFMYIEFTDYGRDGIFRNGFGDSRLGTDPETSP